MLYGSCGVGGGLGFHAELSGSDRNNQDGSDANLPEATLKQGMLFGDMTRTNFSRELRYGAF